MLPSGRILGVGGSRRRLAESFAVFRTSPRGRRERTAFVSFPEAPHAMATAVAIGSRGRIVAAGVARDELGEERVAIAALKPSLERDAAFGADGRVLGSEAADSLGVTAVQIDRAGRIVVAGGASYEDRARSERVFVSRFLPSGAVDTTFADAGVFTAPGEGAADLAVRRDGSILLAARPVPAGARRPSFLMLRLTEGGRLVSRDARRVGRGSAYAGPAEILLRGDGSALVAGTVSDAKDRFAPALLHYGRDGRLESVRRLAQRRRSFAMVGLERRSDGRLLLGGETGYGRWEFRGLTAGGRPDRRFGVHVARNVGSYDVARFADFIVRGRRIVAVGTDEQDERIDYFSYALLAAFKG